jgi:hypothetical protein
VAQDETGENLRGASAAAGPLLLVGWTGTIIRREAGTWSTEHGGTTLFSVAPMTGGGMLTVGTGGAILRRSGTGWVKERSSSPMDLFGVAAVGSDEYVAVGDSGTVLRRVAGTWRNEHRRDRPPLDLVGDGVTAIVGG